MKALVFETFGGPEVLTLSDVPLPVAGAGEVIVRVRAVSLNPSLDIPVRRGTYAKPVILPHVPGVDPSGEIVEIGAGVCGLSIGQRVATTPWVVSSSVDASSRMLGVQVWGGCAEYVRVPASQVHPLPEGLDFPSATVVLRHAPLARRLVLETAGIKAGDWLLVTGAAGGLGHMAVQVGLLAGAHVIAVARTQHARDWLSAVGVDATIDPVAESLAERVAEITDGRGVDAAVETTGVQDLFVAAFEALGRFGRLVTSGGPAAGAAPIDIKRLYLRQLTIAGRTGASPQDVERSIADAAAGRLIPLIDSILPLSAASEIYDHIETGKLKPHGKIIFNPSA